jgi:hypothetical protein
MRRANTETIVCVYKLSKKASSMNTFTVVHSISTFTVRLFCSVRAMWESLLLLHAESIVLVVPIALAATATVLLLLFSVRIVVVLSLDITLAGALFASFSFRDSCLAFAVFFTVDAINAKQNKNVNQ